MEDPLDANGILNGTVHAKIAMAVTKPTTEAEPDSTTPLSNGTNGVYEVESFNIEDQVANGVVIDIVDFKDTLEKLFDDFLATNASEPEIPVQTFPAYSWSLGAAEQHPEYSTFKLPLRWKRQLNMNSFYPKSSFVIQDEKLLATSGNPIITSAKQPPPRSSKKSYKGDSNSEGDEEEEETPRQPQPAIRSLRPRTKRTAHRLLTEQELELLAEADEFLVPIRLEIDYDVHRIRDSLLWNIQDPVCTPDQFANIMCEDLGLPMQLASFVTSSIHTQLEAYQNIVPIAQTIEETEDSPTVTIELDLTVGNTRLEDKFNWDIGQTQLTPEAFARILAADLGVGGEFVSDIAQAIHEQLMIHRKKVYTNWTEGQEEHSIPLGQTLRDLADADQWAPRITTLSEQEVEKLIESKERDVRRRKRTGDDFTLGASGARAARSKSRKINYDESLYDRELMIAEKKAGMAYTSSMSSFPSSSSSSVTSTSLPPSSGFSQVMVTALASSQIIPFQREYGKPNSEGSPRDRTVKPPRERKDVDFDSWRCVHCGLAARETPSLRRGPAGSATLCNACGLYWSVHNMLSEARRGMYKN